MLIPLPIGLWIFSLVCDVIYRFVSSDGVWDEIALYTMAGGLAGALVAAVPRFIDFLALSGDRVRRLALTHMVVNLTVVAAVLLGVAGWLDGELVFRHGVAVDRQQPLIG